MKRVFMFVVTNLAVMLVLGIMLSLFWPSQGLAYHGRSIDYSSLMIFSMLFGFGGAFISLFISKWLAKRSVGAHVITQPANPGEAWLVDTVRRLASQASIGMPEVAIYDAPDVNAFATGWNRNNALVAVSTGLLQNMNRDEAEAVLGHEITHISNGDMVTLTLIQGVVNTFVVFLSRIVGFFVDRVLLKNDRDGVGIGYFVSTIVAQLVLGILASIIVMWFSRQREFRADAGGAHLAGREKMIAALERLKVNHEQAAALPQEMAAFGISSGGGMSRLFMSHPPLEERIAALKALH